MNRRIYSLLVCLLSFVTGFSQEADSAHIIYMPAQVINGDTIVVANLSEVIIGNNRPQFEHRWEEKKYWKLVYNLKKVYPYAKLARQKLDEMNSYFITLKSDRAKKQYTKQVEQEIRAQFEEQLKSLTITQGKLLIKLIYRETGNTSYELVKEFRGGMSAMFWQTLARLFGSNLKTKYEPNGEDQLMEQIVLAIENGEL